MRTMQSNITRALELHMEEFPSLAHLDWVDSREDYGVGVRDRMVEDAEYLRHGAAVFEDGRRISHATRTRCWCPSCGARPRGATHGARRRTRWWPTRGACGTDT